MVKYKGFMKFNEDSTILQASQDEIIGKYIKYIYFDYFEAAKNETISRWSHYALDGINFFYEQAKLGHVKQIFTSKEKSYVSFIHITHNNNSRVVFIVSGGGLSSICHSHEGIPMGKTMFEAGYDVMLVVYSINENAYKNGPIDDLASIIRYGLDNKDKLNINLDKYIVLGGSAGGYVVGQFGTKSNGYIKYNLPKPAMFCLLYPVISLRQEITHLETAKLALNNDLSEENLRNWSINENMDETYPSCYVVHSKDDPAVNVKNSHLLVDQLKKFNIPHVYKEFKTGGHGWSIGKYMEPENWMDGFIKYLKENNI